eukprot:m.311378 g.311378  ORF g.311378 m.311378 type:complete len:163 (-) comp20221_c0_seq8:1701-2189(-)
MADSSDAVQDAPPSEQVSRDDTTVTPATEESNDAETIEAGEQASVTSVPSDDTEVKKQEACSVMFEKIVDYVEGELTDTTANYELLKDLNVAATNEYSQMTSLAAKTNEEMAELRQKYEALQTNFSKIDDLTVAVEKLKAAAKQVDEYSKSLETKFRTLDRR